MSNTTASNSNTGISIGLLMAPFQLNIWFGLFIFVTGNISTFGNFIVFTSKTFRSRACSIYLVAESIFTFIFFNFVLVTRMIHRGFQLPIINRYDPICKIRQFLSQYVHQAAFTMFVFATLDRFLSTHRSTAYRNWSNRVILAYKMTCIIGSVWFLLTGHRLIFYSTSSGTCKPQPGIYEKYDSYFEVIMSGLCPPIVIITLGYLLLRNVRQIRSRRLAPNTTTSSTSHGQGLAQPQIHQIDAQLTTMVLLQSFVAFPSFLPFGAQNLYTSITLNWYKSPLRLAWENVIIELIRLFSYVFYNTSFYISFFSSSGFRRQVFRSLQIPKLTRRINPMQTNIQFNSTNTFRKVEQRNS